MQGVATGVLPNKLSTRLTRPLPVWRYALVAILVACAGALHAAPTSAACREAQSTLDALSVELEHLSRRHQQLIALRQDTLPAEASLADVLAVDLSNDSAVQAHLQKPTVTDSLDDWPDSVDCRELAPRYQEALDDGRWLVRAIQREKQQWLGLPATLRSAVVALWQSRQQLAMEYEALETALRDSNSQIEPGDTQPGAIQAQSHAQRADLLALLAQADQLDSEHINAFFTLWHTLLATPLPSYQQETLSLPDSLPLDAYLRAAREDALQLRYTGNRLREWLWQQNPALIHLAAASHGNPVTTLLRDELRTLLLSLEDVLNDVHEEFIERPQQTRPLTALLATSARYAFGLFALLLLSQLARKTARPLLKLHERLTHATRGHRFLSKLARLVGGIIPVLPWLAGWLGLLLLEQLFRHYRLDTLVALMPVTYLYIVYGVAALFFEWLVLRISQQAGVYLSGDQAAQIRPQAQNTARIIVAPWLLWVLLDGTLGDSLMLQLWMLASLLTLYLATGWLLARRRNELINALQSTLPEKLDASAERLFGGKALALLAPLTLLPLLLAFVFDFLNKLMFDVDWYRSLTARWFKMRVQTSEDEETNQAGSGIADEYSSWFSETPQDTDPPYIESGLLPALRKPLDRWFEESTEENTLLLTGERGIGKSRALAKLKATLADEHPELRIRHTHVPAKTLTAASTLQLVGRLLDCDLSEGPAALVSSDKEREPTLVILDDAQNFFLSTVGGLEAWKTLLSLTNSRLENVFWLITIHNQSWAYLGNVFGRDYQFRNVLRAKRWSQHDIRSLILSRNHLSGFKIRYDDVLLASRGPEAGNIRNAEQRYFSLLWDACNGNPMLALRLWLSSVRTHGDTVTVGLPSTPSLPQADKLGANLLFVYAAIVTHENLTSEEISATTALPDSVVRYALKTGFDAGFIQRDEDTRYRLVPSWYYTITNLLARKNLLHE